MPTSIRRPRRRQFSVLIGVLALSSCLGGRAAADFAVSNLGSGRGFDPNNGYNLTGPQALNNQGYAIAVRFQVNSPSAVAFDSALLGLTYRNGTNALDISLMTDGGGIPSGTALETIHLTGIPTAPGFVNVVSTAHPILTAGFSYWLVAAYGAPDTNIGWMMNNTGQSGHSAYRSDLASGPGTWVNDANDNDPSYAIHGAFVGPTVAGGVPTPPSLVLLGIGGVGLLASPWTRRSLLRIPATIS